LFFVGARQKLKRLAYVSSVCFPIDQSIKPFRI